MRHAVIIGHGDNDPHGIDLNDDCNYEIVENGLDLGTPDPVQDRRTITLYIRILGRTEGIILRRLQTLSRWVTRAAQRHAGTVAPVTLRLEGDGWGTASRPGR